MDPWCIIECEDAPDFVVPCCVFVELAELRSRRIAFWAKLDPSFVCEVWPGAQAEVDGPVTATVRAWLEQPSGTPFEALA